MPKLHFFTQAEKETPKPKPPNDKYRLANWSDYNKALINRGLFAIWLDDDTLANWYFQRARTPGGLIRYCSGDPVRPMHSVGTGSQSGLSARVSTDTRLDSEPISDYEDGFISTLL